MHIRKAILTGGGRATRLRPITATINKHLIPLANKPMIFHAIEKAAEAGVTEIFINTNPGETQLQQYVGDGGHWGIKIKFFEQTGGPQGIAHVVKCAQEFVGDEPFLFYLSDNIVLGSLQSIFNQFEQEKLDCLLSFARVPDPERFGVPVFDGAGKLTAVLEKPRTPPSNLAQTGIYLYSGKVFFDAFDKIKKSNRGEYEISDIHTYLLQNGFKVDWREVTGFWKDTGKPEDLILSNQLLLDALPPEEKHFKVCGVMETGAQVEGKVHCGAGTTVNKNVKIIGPVMVGENCTLSDCAIGPHVTIGAGCVIKRAVIRESIIFSHSVIDAPITIVDSIIGDQARIIRSKPDSHHRLILGDQTVVEV